MAKENFNPLSAGGGISLDELKKQLPTETAEQSAEETTLDEIEKLAEEIGVEMEHESVSPEQYKVYGNIQQDLAVYHHLKTQGSLGGSWSKKSYSKTKPADFLQIMQDKLNEARKLSTKEVAQDEEVAVPELDLVADEQNDLEAVGAFGDDEIKPTTPVEPLATEVPSVEKKAVEVDETDEVKFIKEFKKARKALNKASEDRVLAKRLMAKHSYLGPLSEGEADLVYDKFIQTFKTEVDKIQAGEKPDFDAVDNFDFQRALNEVREEHKKTEVEVLEPIVEDESPEDVGKFPDSNEEPIDVKFEDQKKEGGSKKSGPVALPPIEPVTSGALNPKQKNHEVAELLARGTKAKEDNAAAADKLKTTEAEAAQLLKQIEDREAESARITKEAEEDLQKYEEIIREKETREKIAKIKTELNEINKSPEEFSRRQRAEEIANQPLKNATEAGFARRKKTNLTPDEMVHEREEAIRKLETSLIRARKTETIVETPVPPETPVEIPPPAPEAPKQKEEPLFVEQFTEADITDVVASRSQAETTEAKPGLISRTFAKIGDIGKKIKGYFSYQGERPMHEDELRSQVENAKFTTGQTVEFIDSRGQKVTGVINKVPNGTNQPWYDISSKTLFGSGSREMVDPKKVFAKNSPTEVLRRVESPEQKALDEIDKAYTKVTRRLDQIRVWSRKQKISIEEYLSKDPDLLPYLKSKLDKLEAKYQNDPITNVKQALKTKLKNARDNIRFIEKQLVNSKPEEEVAPVETEFKEPKGPYDEANDLPSLIKIIEEAGEIESSAGKIPSSEVIASILVGNFGRGRFDTNITSRFGLRKKAEELYNKTSAQDKAKMREEYLKKYKGQVA